MIGKEVKKKLKDNKSENLFSFLLYSKNYPNKVTADECGDQSDG